jgi:hypothetical protein
MTIDYEIETLREQLGSVLNIKTEDIRTADAIQRKYRVSKDFSAFGTSGFPHEI